MSNDISFDDNNKFMYKSRSILGDPQTPKMISFLINKKIVKNEQNAQKLLFSLTFLFLLTSIYIFAVFVFDFKIGSSSNVNPEQFQAAREKMEQIKNQRTINPNNIQNQQ